MSDNGFDKSTGKRVEVLTVMKPTRWLYSVASEFQTIHTSLLHTPQETTPNSDKTEHFNATSNRGQCHPTV